MKALLPVLLTAAAAFFLFGLTATFERESAGGLRLLHALGCVGCALAAVSLLTRSVSADAHELGVGSQKAKRPPGVQTTAPRERYPSE